MYVVPLALVMAGAWETVAVLLPDTEFPATGVTVTLKEYEPPKHKCGCR